MTVIRVGCYERVSTDEQALHGYSIGTQIDCLDDYCKKNKMKIVDHYTDAGVSGGKAMINRPEMKRLLDDVQDGKIDMILFTKLDRWFRNIKEYFKVQEILEKHKVEWKAIHEDYDTTTANGRMAITLFLAIAQNEREKTSERIKVVMEHKRKNKEACFGGPNLPLGYIKEKDENGVLRLIKDPETKDMMSDFWALVIKYNTVTKAIRHVKEVYGVERDPKSWYALVRNEMYCGRYKGVEDYCEPYVSVEEWLKFQETRLYRDTRPTRIYLFSGMMRCPECGKTLAGTCDKTKRKGVVYEYKNYKCCKRTANFCTNMKQIPEIRTEKMLLNNLEKLLRDEIAKVELERTKPKPKPKVNIPALKERLRRLDVTYMAGNKTDEEYLKEQGEIKLLIAKAEKEEPQADERDLSPLYAILETDFKSIYKTLNDEDKRRFWRSIIKEMKVDGNNVSEVVFF